MNMKANVIVKHGVASEVFQMIEMELPSIKSDEVLVRVYYTSVNPLDCRIRLISNSQRVFPITLGYDVYGEVVESGSKVTDIKVGDKIIASPSPFFAGANAEFVSIKSVLCLVVDGIDPILGAAIPLVGITAYEALFHKLKVQQGETILIHAGAGGVGHIAVQLAKNIGCKVITTASRPESIIFCKQKLQADYVINYKTENLKGQIDLITNSKGLSKIFDTVGDQTFIQSLDCLSLNGHICTILPVVLDMTASYKNLLKNINMSYEFMAVSGFSGRHRIILDELVRFIKEGKLKPHISAVYNFKDIAKAHESIEEKHTMGKLVIKI
jgi:NADPH2:quinone reductase